MLSFLKKHLYETALAVVILVFGSSIVALYKSILEALNAYPLEIAILCISVMLVSLFVLSLLDRRAAMLRAIEEDGESERARIEAEKEKDIRRMERDFIEQDRERERCEMLESLDKERSDRIRQFSEVQLTYMIHCLCEERTDRGIGIKTHAFDAVSESLESVGVFTQASRIDEYERCFYTLTPEWRKFVIEAEQDIRDYIGK